MKLKRISIVGIILFLICSSLNVNAIFPKSIDEDFWVDGFFEGTISLDGSEGVINGRINLARNSKNGVFQAEIILENISYESKGWFRENILFGVCSNNNQGFPLIGRLDLQRTNFDINLLFPKGSIIGDYTASYLPLINGDYGIGVEEYHIIDESRFEELSDNPDDFREFMVKVWYPTDKDVEGDWYNYMTDVMFAWLMGRAPIPLPGVSDDAFLDVMPHGKINVPLSSDSSVFPVVLFIHGLDGTIEIYTSFIEELVSNGYIVFSINHPYVAGVVEFPDGRAIYYGDASTQNNTEYFEIAFRAIVEDAKYTIDFAEFLNNDDGIFKDRLDLDNIGMYGHSFGGGSTSVCCAEDDRIDCGLTLDGVSYEELIPEGVTKPFFMMTADGKINSTGVNYIWDKQETDVFKMSLFGSSHFGFTDVGILLKHMLPLIPQDILGFGTIDSKVMVEIVRLFIVEFFDVYLKDGSVQNILDLADDFSDFIEFEYK